MRHILYFTLIISCLVFSCKPSEILPGFKLYEAPNAIDKPGRIYRLGNDNKTDYLVEYLPVNPQPKNIIIPEKEKSKTLNIGSVLSFISKSSNVNASGSFNSDKVSNFNFKLGDAQIYKISDEELRPQYASMKKRITDDIKLFGLQSPKYFIVRESVTAKEIFIQTTKNVKNDAKFKADVESLVNANANLSWTSNSKDEIKVTLKDGLFVFYKPEEITLQTSAAGDTEIIIKEASKSDIERLKIGVK